MVEINAYSLKNDGGKNLSANFQVKEFKCNDGSDAVLVAPALVLLLQNIRDHFGKPVTVNSAYRTAAWNANQGGAPKSQHLRGMAADITIPGVTPLEVAQYAEFLQPKTGGIGVYKSFTHVDVRSSRARWDSRSGKEMAVSGWTGYTGETELDKAVDKLVKAGVIDSPARWKSGDWTNRAVELLIIKMAARV